MAFLNWFKRCTMNHQALASKSSLTTSVVRDIASKSESVLKVDANGLEGRLPCDLNEVLSSSFCAALFTTDRQLASLDLRDPLTPHDLSSMREICRKRNDIFFTVESNGDSEIRRYRVLLGDCQTGGDNVGFIVVNPDDWKVEFDRPLIVAELTRELNQFFGLIVFEAMYGRRLSIDQMVR